MTATNHALTGAAIGLIIGRPLLAIPVALASHFICDALPHFGFPNIDQTIKTKLFRNYLIGEAALCALIVAVLAVLAPAHWQLAAICAFVAASPDLLSYNGYISTVKRKAWKPGLYVRFAKGIQWFERPIGAAVELCWAAAVLIMVKPFL